MKRLTMTCQAARLLEMQLTQWAEKRDEHGKLTADARERRRWNRMADKFVDAAGAYDQKMQSLTTDLVAFVDTCVTEQAAMATSLLAVWKEQTPDAADANKSVEALKELYNLRINAANREANAVMNKINDDPVLGQATCHVDLNDDDPKWIEDTFEKVDTSSDRQTRKVINQILEALASAVELVADAEGRYIPKKPTLVEKAS